MKPLAAEWVSKSDVDLLAAHTQRRVALRVDPESAAKAAAGLAVAFAETYA